MATLAYPATAPRDGRFFLIMAFVFAGLVVAGFSTQLAMGRSSFAAPLLLHAHAVVFMGWIVLYVLQNVFAANGSMALHRRLGWIGAGWIVAMVVLGIAVTIGMVRRGAVPFFFTPLQFVVFDPLALFFFAGLTFAAIAKRRETDWHRRLHFCATAMLMGPAFGRLLPMPLLAPFAFEATFAAVMLLPLAGILADLRRTGTVHKAWLWGVGAMLASLVLTETITYGPAGPPLYRVLTQGSPGAAVAPLDYPPPPTDALITGRRESI